MCRVFESHGFTEVRRRGNHIVMQRMCEDRTTRVPVPNHREQRTGALMSILRQSPRGHVRDGEPRHRDGTIEWQNPYKPERVQRLQAGLE